MQLEADIEFVAPAQREIDAYVENGLPVYAYSFNYFPKSPIYEEEEKKYTIFGQETIKVKRKELHIRRMFWIVLVYFKKKKKNYFQYLSKND